MTTSIVGPSRLPPRPSIKDESASRPPAKPVVVKGKVRKHFPSVPKQNTLSAFWEEYDSYSHHEIVTYLRAQSPLSRFLRNGL